MKNNNLIIRSTSAEFLIFEMQKEEALKLALNSEKPVLIFCGTRAKAEDMSRELQDYLESYDSVKFYHAGLTREEKNNVEKWFYPKDNAYLCATIAFGMGVDKKNIRTVIHLEPSSTAEAYIQEAGRAGRDGKTSNAYLLWSKSLIELQKLLVKMALLKCFTLIKVIFLVMIL